MRKYITFTNSLVKLGVKSIEVKVSVIKAVKFPFIFSHVLQVVFGLNYLGYTVHSVRFRYKVRG